MRESATDARGHHGALLRRSLAVDPRDRAPSSLPLPPRRPNPCLRAPSIHSHPENSSAVSPRSPWALLVPNSRRKSVADLLAHLAANVREALLAVKAHGLDPTVSEHLEDLGVLLAVLCGCEREREGESVIVSAPVGRDKERRRRTLEDELALVRLVLVLSSSTVLASLRSATQQSESAVGPLSRPPPPAARSLIPRLLSRGRSG